MTKRNQNQFVLRILALVVMLTAGACYDVKAANQPPTAVISVSANGAPVVANSPIPFMDQPVTITLDGSKSTDADGNVVSYTWRRTDVTAASRFGLTPAGTGGMTASGSGGMTASGSGGMPASGTGGAGSDEDGGVTGTGGMMAMMPMMPMTPAMPAAAPAPAFMGDPPATQMAQVELKQKGKYRYSLWVKDNDGAISAPASFIVKLGGFSPEATCGMAYMQPNMDCHDCTCTPNAMGGCLDEAKACLQATDPEFKMLCTAVVNCAIAKKCTGSACYTGGCMAEITAAAMYMGGSITSCDASMAATNPCGASAALSACQMKPMCSDVCK